MLGQAIAALEPISHRWLQHVWGYSDIHTRQKWMVVWPHLARLPENGLRLLDAGCGPGDWALELAARRPGWSVVGLDREEKSLQAAEAARRHLRLSNVSFVPSDFLDFQTAEPFDVVLSVCSAHYLVENGQGGELFQCIRTWLKSDGRLFLLGPRQVQEAPFVSWLPRPQWHSAFSFEDLSHLCQANELAIEILCGRIGPLGTLAKQLAWIGESRFRLLARGLYPLQWVLTSLDARARLRNRQSTMMWLLVARATD
jgi:SAM-dependent methyltransferase